MSRRFFAAGCWVLIALGLVHLLGHYSLVTSTGLDDTHRQLLALMRGYTRDMGLGFVRSTMDIVAGFSLAFSVLSAGLGLLGLVVARHAPLVRAAAAVETAVFGIMTGVAIRYWFPVPLAFVALAFLCFLAALIAPASRSPQS